MRSCLWRAFVSHLQYSCFHTPQMLLCISSNLGFVSCVRIGLIFFLCGNYLSWTHPCPLALRATCLKSRFRRRFFARREQLYGEAGAEELEHLAGPHRRHCLHTALSATRASYKHRRHGKLQPLLQRLKTRLARIQAPPRFLALSRRPTMVIAALGTAFCTKYSPRRATVRS